MLLTLLDLSQLTWTPQRPHVVAADPGTSVLYSVVDVVVAEEAVVAEVVVADVVAAAEAIDPMMAIPKDPMDLVQA